MMVEQRRQPVIYSVQHTVTGWNDGPLLQRSQPMAGATPSRQVLVEQRVGGDDRERAKAVALLRGTVGIGDMLPAPRNCRILSGP